MLSITTGKRTCQFKVKEHKKTFAIIWAKILENCDITFAGCFQKQIHICQEKQVPKLATAEFTKVRWF